MLFNKRGLVASIKDGRCIIITDKGTYEKTQVPATGASVGAQLTYRSPIICSAIEHFSLRRPVLKPIFLAASFFVLFVVCVLSNQSALPQAMAYVSVDINPSLEMSVGKDMKVINVTCFNNDATELVSQERLNGQPIYNALHILIGGAIAQKYIKSGQDNLVLSTVAPETASNRITQQAVQQDLANSIKSAGLVGTVKTYSITDEYREMAENKGLSPARFLLYAQMIKSGDVISVDGVSQANISNLVHSYKISLIPDGGHVAIIRAGNNELNAIEVDNTGNVVPIFLPFAPHSYDNMSYNGNTHDHSGLTEGARREMTKHNDHMSRYKDTTRHINSSKYKNMSKNAPNIPAIAARLVAHTKGHFRKIEGLKQNRTYHNTSHHRQISQP